MTVLRWRVRHFVSLVIPALVFLSVASFEIAGLRARFPELGNRFVGEDTGRFAAIAHSLHRWGVYGLRDDSASPAQRGVLWSLALAAGTAVLGSPEAASRMLSALSGLVLIVVIWRMASSIFPFPPFVVFAAASVGLVPGLAGEVARGSPGVLTAALIVGALWSYLCTLRAHSYRFSMLPAFLSGVAGWIHPVFAGVWVVMAVHALIPLGAPRWGLRHRLLYVMEGSLVVALVMAPLFLWNAWHWHVPWLEEPGSSVSAASFKRGMEGAMRSWRIAARGYYVGILVGWFTTGALAGLVPMACFSVGLLLLVGLGIQSDSERHLSVLIGLLILVLPAVAGALMPFLTPSETVEVLLPFQPLVAVVAAHGFFRLPFVLERAYRRWKPGLPEGMGFRVWWCVVGILLAASWLSYGWRTESRRVADWMGELGRADRIRTILEQRQLTEGVIATDVPGLLHCAGLGECGLACVTGQSDPIFLACGKKTSQTDWECIFSRCRRVAAKAAVLWSCADEQHADWSRFGVMRLDAAGLPPGSTVLLFPSAAAGKTAAEDSGSPPAESP